MKSVFVVTACALALSAVAGAANAAVLQFGGTLTGAQESPPTGSPGIGVTTITFNTATQILTVTESFANLAFPTTLSHIHCCTAPGTNTGVATPLPSFPGFPAGVTSGSYSNTFDLSLASSYNPAFVTANGGTAASAEAAFLAGLQSGQAYLNIHTSGNPGGEIRTFLSPTPEPATWAMLIVGFGMVGAGLRRRRADLAAA